MIGFREYMGYAEAHLTQAHVELQQSLEVERFLIPSTILAWAAIEAFVNNMLDDFGSLPEGLFELHERALLLERRIKFIQSGDQIGQFILEGKEHRRLEDKIFFLITKFSKQASVNIKGDSLWQRFEDFKDTRDALIHPRRDKEIGLSVAHVESFIETSKALIRLISEHVWGREVSF
jgi:hypothetical protein